jgi:hypothetical protein
MVRRGFTVLLVALAPACAGAAGFTDAPQPGQLAALAGACVLAAVLQTITGSTVQPQKNSQCHKIVISSVLQRGP